MNAEAAAPSPSVDERRIFVIESSDRARDALVGMLAGCGEVLGLASHVSAVEMALGGAPHLVVFGETYLLAHGMGMVAAVARSLGGPASLVVAASAASPLLAQAGGCEADAVLACPSAEELRCKVEQLLGRAGAAPAAAAASVLRTS